MNFPFSAVVAQPDYKLALMLVAINSAIDGVLVSGPRGLAKSTMARSFADLLPGDKHPFVNVPLGVSEEMLCGTLNLQKVMAEQTVDFLPGLLHKAHQGMLYVDEVNLLPDFIVDLLLDVAASGINTVERDGISHSHAANFVLLGTMNPDEGELRPQLLDRFGLCVELNADFSRDDRIKIVQLRESFDRDPEGFARKYTKQQKELTQKIEEAKDFLSQVSCPMPQREKIADECASAQVDGLRADIVWLQAALAHAALSKRATVTDEDVNLVRELVLTHRRKNNRADDSPPNSPSSGSQNNLSSNTNSHFSRPEEKITSNDQSSQSLDGDWGRMPPKVQLSNQEVIQIPDASSLLSSKPIRSTSSSNGDYRTGNARHKSRSGKKVLSVASDRIHWFASLIKNRGVWPLRDMAYKSQTFAENHIHLIMMDTSASMLKGQAFSKAKSAVIAIARKAYLERQKIIVLGFGNQEVNLLMPLVRAPKHIQQWLDQLSSAGGTPLFEGVEKAAKLQKQLSLKYTAISFTNYLITDGRVRQQNYRSVLEGQTLLIDVESSAVKRGRGFEISNFLSADYMPIGGGV